jgi:colanic acid/amylovoran biosynthesis glycosyltransferase
MTASGQPTVGHLIGVFLPLTANWLYEQMRAVRGACSVVLAKVRERESEFTWDPVYALDSGSKLRRLANRVARKIVGHYPDWERAARREGVRLLHAHFGPFGIHGLSLARALEVPLITSFYGVDIWKHKGGEAGLRQRYAPLFAKGAAFLVEGPAAAERVVSLGCSPSKVHVHRLGIDLSVIPFVPRTHPRGQPIRILMAARFSEKKGIPYGVEAFCRVAKHDLRLELTIVGGPGDSPAERAIEDEVHSLIARHGLTSRVRLPGMLSRATLRALFLEHHIFLHPSVRALDGDAEGGHPVVITEAAASGLPIIGTTHCDIPQIVAHGETGWLCRERDSDALASALRDAVADPERLTRFGAAARRLVERYYDISVQRWDTVYQQFIPELRPHRTNQETPTPVAAV